jgi:LPS sulfotransferase NodH
MSTLKNNIKFCIITTQRSGSTWLQELLNCHPQINIFGELFLWGKNRSEWMKKSLPEIYYNHHTTSKSETDIQLERSMPKYKDFKIKHKLKLRPWSIWQYLELLENNDRYPYAVGFKIMYNQLLPRPEILIKMAAKNYKLIHLVRQNHLDVFISKSSMKQHGLVHLKDDIDPKKVTLDITSLLQKLKFRDGMISTARQALKLVPCPLLEITYESLYSSRDDILDSIVKFLDIQDMNIDYTSNLRKINKGLYHEKIENYEEVKEALLKTKFKDLIIQ